MSELEFVAADVPTINEEDEADIVDDDDDYDEEEKPTNAPKVYKIFGTTKYQRMMEIM